jgi:hypothetical protein
VLLDLPHTPGLAALRSALMALRLPPTPLPAAAAARRRSFAAMTADTLTIAFLDISHRQGTPANGLVDLFTHAPIGAARQRVMLMRMSEGHVSEEDRRWVRELGFADLLPEPEASDPEGVLRQAVDWAAATLGVPALAGEELARFARASATGVTELTPRALIRRRTGLAAEAFAERLAAVLDIQDRRWLLHSYPRCFVGSEAVQRIAATWACTPAEAVELGRALARLGLLVHVVAEHDFGEENLYFRLSIDDGALGPSLGALWETLSLAGGVQAKTRSYLGKSYPDCWVGSDAVERLCKRHSLTRLQAWLALHRMMQFGLFEHVTRARPFIDGDFYYRFAPVAP